MIRRRKLTRREIEEIANRSLGSSDFSGQSAQHDHQWAERVTENMKAMEPVIAELREEGFQVDYISDLRNRRLNYKLAIPILLKWVTVVENRDIKKEIIATLGTKFAKPIAAPILIKEFKNISEDDLILRWTVGNALSFVADDNVYEEIIELVQNRAYGQAREMLVVSLANMHNPQAIDVLIELLSDEEVAGHAVMALGRLKAEKAKVFIEPFLHHGKSWIRREAKRALVKIGQST